MNDKHEKDSQDGPFIIEAPDAHILSKLAGSTLLPGLRVTLPSGRELSEEALQVCTLFVDVQSMLPDSSDRDADH